MRCVFRGKLCWLGVLLAALATVFSACETTAPTGGGQARSPVGGNTTTNLLIIRVGDKIRVEFSDEDLKPIETEIKDDGSISFPLIGSVQAAGRTARQLQDAILEKYVPRLYQRLNVTVTLGDRYYYVGGEVKFGDKKIYVSGMTVLKAIQSAGGFTDYANKKRVQLTRASGETLIINCKKALTNPKLDLEVFPYDQITVERGIL